MLHIFWKASIEVWSSLIAQRDLVSSAAARKNWKPFAAHFMTYQHSLYLVAFICGLVSVDFTHISLQWRHNELDGVSNHQTRDCLLNRLFRNRKHQSSASLALVRWIHRWPMNSPHKGPVTRTIIPIDDVIVFQNYVTILVAIIRLHLSHINYQGT